ncbi:MAG: RNA-directed DNA polymerase [Candidatus Methylomirabilales bacterium]
MTAAIPGINRTSLWNAWKLVRKQIKNATLRDVIDYLEYDIDPDKWIDRLLRDIAAGAYEPGAPRRYMLAKSKGFSRRMTLPEIPDLVLYRAIVEHLYRQMRLREHKHVYFEKAKLSKVAQQAAASAAEAQKAASQYGVTSVSRFLAWLHFTQYRKHLIFDEIYPFIVTTDITNFFDTVLHARIADILYGASAPPRMIGLLFLLLERLSIRDPYTDSPRIGLPVDEFDCSRKLAHIFLFPHDDRIVRAIGEEAYVRWMDDQTMGVASRASGLRLLAELGDSLGRLHLTPNSLKTRLLSLSEARRHFHLDINQMIDRAEELTQT